MRLCGLVIAPGNAAVLAAALSKLTDDVFARIQLGSEARRFAVENLGRDQVLGRFSLELMPLAT